ncbi:MAG TPA: hypothetical protein EYP59_04055 [Thiotrichaceae bacterium]|nr:hypothetical protein [Thiotrichaceae bacterium]
MIKIWINKKTRRHYTAHFQEDLLGDLILVQSWGSLDSGVGRIQKRLMQNKREGFLAVEAISRTRKKHKYTLINKEAKSGQ